MIQRNVRGWLARTAVTGRRRRRAGGSKQLKRYKRLYVEYYAGRGPVRRRARSKLQREAACTIQRYVEAKNYAAGTEPDSAVETAEP
eukprot:symbB.v1.2.008506.t1/scaffold527.1/size293072/4